MDAPDIKKDKTKELPELSLNTKFIEWFVGLCEAESNFLIRTRKNEKEEVSGFEFVFRITLLLFLFVPTFSFKRGGVLTLII